MKLTLRLVFALATLLWSSGAAHAGSILFSNLGPGDTYATTGGTPVTGPSNAFVIFTGIDRDRAMGFIPLITATVDSLTVPLGLGTGTSAIKFAVASDSGGTFLMTEIPTDLIDGSWLQGRRLERATVRSTASWPS